MENEIEVWKDVPNYEGKYQVSSLGRIKSLQEYRGTTDERILKQSNTGRGRDYPTSYLYKYNKKKSIATHQLVAMAFLGHVPDGTHRIVVDHIDNDKSNNHISNLRLITNRENCSKDKKNTYSNFTGVCWHQKSSKWVVHIKFKKRYIHLGLFELEIDAHNAYQKALKEIEQGLDLNILYPKNVETSQYVGVHWDKSRNKWIARYGSKYLGRFETELEAHQAVQNYIESLKLLV